MARKRIRMEKIRTILRYSETTQLSERQIARAMNVSRTVVSKYVQGFRSSGLRLEELEGMADSELSARLAGTGNPPKRPRYTALCARFPAMLKEVRKQGVTLELLWEEYLQECPQGYTTAEDHMPPRHRWYATWTPERFLSWAQTLGEEVQEAIRQALDSRTYPQQAYNTCMGILNLEKTYGASRPTACDRGHVDSPWVWRRIGRGCLVALSCLDLLGDSGYIERTVFRTEADSASHKRYQREKESIQADQGSRRVS